MLADDFLQLGIAGATIKEVQIRLGHKDVKTTLDVNIHVTKKAKASPIEKSDNYLSNGILF